MRDVLSRRDHPKVAISTHHVENFIVFRQHDHGGVANLRMQRNNTPLRGRDFTDTDRLRREGCGAQRDENERSNESSGTHGYLLDQAEAARRSKPAAKPYSRKMV